MTNDKHFEPLYNLWDPQVVTKEPQAAQASALSI